MSTELNLPSRALCTLNESFTSPGFSPNWLWRHIPVASPLSQNFLLAYFWSTGLTGDIQLRRKKKKIEVRNEYQERRNGIIKPIDTRMASIYMLYLMLFKFLILCTHVSTRAESPRSQMLVLPDFTCLSVSLILLKIFIFKNSLLL